MQSIKIFLLIVLLSVICITNFLAVIQGYRSSLQVAEAQLEQQLTAQAELLQVLLQQPASIPTELFQNTSLFQVWQQDTLLYHSENAPEKILQTKTDGYHFASYNGKRWRILIINLNTNQQLLVGQQHDHYVGLIETILLQSILPIIWILPLLALLIWLVIYFGLKPVHRLSKKLLQRKTTDFSPLNKQDYPQELAVVIESINQVLLRLSAAFEREHRFAADAAHELRTPLTAIKLSLHNLATELKSEHQAVLSQLDRSIDKMTHTISQLLSLYRLTPDRFRQSLQQLELLALLQQIIIDYYERLQQRQQQIELQGEPILIQGDEFALMTMFNNLLDNASKYSPAGGKIQISLRTVSGNVNILIEDSGSGIPAEEYDRVFNRFYRVGGDRHHSGISGAGLGLSIVEHVINLHQGKIYLSRSDQLGGLAVEVRLPIQQTTGE